MSTNPTADPLARSFRYWPVVVVAILVSAVALAGAAALQSTSWSSSAKILYGRDSSSLLSGVVASDNDVQRTLATQAEVILSDSVMIPASEQLKVPLDDLIEATNVKDLPDSNVITISVKARSANEAQERTQVIADGYVRHTREQARGTLERQAASLLPSIKRLRGEIADSKALSNSAPATTADQSVSTALAALVQRRNQLLAAASAEDGPASVIAKPQVPRAPSSVSSATAAVLGGGIGAVLGVGLMLVLGRSTTRRPYNSSARSTTRGDPAALSSNRAS